LNQQQRQGYWAGRHANQFLTPGFLSFPQTPFFSPLSFLPPAMKHYNDAYLASENYEFNQFNEDELAMIMGGGGDEPSLEFLAHELPRPEDERPS
jgi:hypothetical protein